jgi:hypothetical protein
MNSNSINSFREKSFRKLTLSSEDIFIPLALGQTTPRNPFKTFEQTIVNPHSKTDF